MEKKIEEISKAIENDKKPIIVEKLELNDKEMYLGNLPDADKFQVLCRHLSIIEQSIQAGVNSQNMFLSYIFEIMKEKAEKEGINVNKLIEKKF